MGLRSTLGQGTAPDRKGGMNGISSITTFELVKLANRSRFSQTVKDPALSQPLRLALARHPRPLTTGSERVDPPQQIFPPHRPKVPSFRGRSYHVHTDGILLNQIWFDDTPPLSLRKKAPVVICRFVKNQTPGSATARPCLPLPKSQSQAPEISPDRRRSLIRPGTAKRAQHFKREPGENETGRCRDRTNPLWVLTRRWLLPAARGGWGAKRSMNVLRRRSYSRPIRRLSGADSHSPPIVQSFARY